MHREHFEIRSLLEPLVGEFQLLAREKGLQLRYARCTGVIRSDARLLRRILQNFVSTPCATPAAARSWSAPAGRAGRSVSKSGIRAPASGPSDSARSSRSSGASIRRAVTPSVDWALGLAIAERTARLLECPLSLRSWPGRGSVFAITVALGERSAMQKLPIARANDPDRVVGSVVMCVENEAAVLSGIEALLSQWGCEVLAARNRESALACIDGRPPDLLLVDYHLDGDVSGVTVAEELQAKLNVDVPGMHSRPIRPTIKQDAALRGFQVLQKPLKPAALRAMMNRMLA